MSEVLASLSAPKDFIITPNITGAMATLQAILLTCDLGCYKIVFERDALQMIQALWKERLNWYRYDYLIEEARGVLSSMHSWQVNHISRQFNEAAHCLAKETLDISEDHVRIVQAPICIFAIISWKCCT